MVYKICQIKNIILQVKYINKVCTRVYDCICSKRNDNLRKQTKRLVYTRFELCIKLKMGILRKYLININLFINLMENRSHFQRIYNTAAKVNV